MRVTQRHGETQQHKGAAREPLEEPARGLPDARRGPPALAVAARRPRRRGGGRHGPGPGAARLGGQPRCREEGGSQPRVVGLPEPLPAASRSRGDQEDASPGNAGALLPRGVARRRAAASRPACLAAGLAAPLVRHPGETPGPAGGCLAGILGRLSGVFHGHPLRVHAAGLPRRAHPCLWWTARGGHPGSGRGRLAGAPRAALREPARGARLPEALPGALPRVR
mmetsp:Transcript_32856/g.93781  ORF Transcript_32856/g.93781 Transcript_32856/m.93781 type:complete len:224 (+) Transcript_32856:130-801(+)